MTIARALDVLTPFLGDRLSRAKADLETHGRSEAHFAPLPPDAVAWPRDTAEVAQIVKICAEHDCPIIAYGAGTSLEGHALAAKGGLVLNMTRMDKVLEINAEDMDARVQPGITRERLNDELRATGLFFSVDPGANATLGGMASTRASGTTAVRYGTMRDNVLGLEVVLADGRIIRTGGRARKSASGYDLTGLIVGAEGTLGIITELVIKLAGQPEAVSAATCSFETIEGAVNAVIETIQYGVPMARIEFIDAATAAALNARHGTDLALTPHLMTEFHGSPAAVAEQAETLASIAAEHGGKDFKWSAKEEERKALWQMRHHAYWLILASKPGSTAIVTDCCVPLSKLAQAVIETQDDIAASAISGPILGHVGDGNFHAILLIDPDNADERAQAEALAGRLAERALRLGGTVTGEHGIGMGKLAYMAAEHGEAWQVMAQIKHALDPRNIMNPGKVTAGAENTVGTENAV
ncbi:MAG: FAD-binding protein [Rhodobacteraceae bacterium]|nr:FAD-binding protein [Paracoccaceae bacterium]